MTIKQLVLPNYFTKETHYYADAFASAVNTNKIYFIKEYMSLKLKFKAQIKYNEQKNITFIDLDGIGGHEYSDVITLRGNPQVDAIKDWLINKW
jgi:hypothetical protein